MRPFVYISVKNLAKISTWCDENWDHPLSRMYGDVCVGIGGMMEELIPASTAIAPLWPGIPKYETRPYPQLLMAKTVAYEARDRIGRVILEVIKRSAL